MCRLRDFALQHLGVLPRQVQVFTPTPSTLSTAMYCARLDPGTGEPLHVARGTRERERQKEIIVPKPTRSQKRRKP